MGGIILGLFTLARTLGSAARVGGRGPEADVTGADTRAVTQLSGPVADATGVAGVLRAAGQTSWRTRYALTQNCVRVGPGGANLDAGLSAREEESGLADAPPGVGGRLEEVPALLAAGSVHAEATIRETAPAEPLRVLVGCFPAIDTVCARVAGL